MNADGVKHISEFSDAVWDEMNRPHLVTIEDGYFLIHDPEQYDSTYEIPVNDMHDATRALEWVRQLAEKRWVTRQVIVDFANAALDYGAPHATELAHA